MKVHHLTYAMAALIFNDMGSNNNINNNNNFTGTVLTIIIN